MFELSFCKAERIISSAKGYIEHELQKSLEERDKYLLIVRWQTLEHHVTEFRQSDAYLKWKELLHHFYHPFPIVEHYTRIH